MLQLHKPHLELVQASVHSNTHTHTHTHAEQIMDSCVFGVKDTASPSFFSRFISSLLGGDEWFCCVLV